MRRGSEVGLPETELKKLAGRTMKEMAIEESLNFFAYIGLMLVHGAHIDIYSK